MNSLVIFLVVRCVAIVHSQYSEILKPLKGYSFQGSPRYSFQTVFMIVCSITCSRDNNCGGFSLVNRQCNTYSVADVSYSSGSLDSLYFLNLDRLAVPRPPAITTPEGPYGTFDPFYYCAKNKGVNAINVWYEFYTGPEKIPDDGGISEVEIVCSGTDGIVDSTKKQGLYNSAATKRSFQCPTASFIYAVQFMQMPLKGTAVDDATMVGIAVMCNDLANTTQALASGEGTSLYPWTVWQACDAGFVICGFSLQVDPDRTLDMTCVNGMYTTCCLIT